MASSSSSSEGRVSLSSSRELAIDRLDDDVTIGPAIEIRVPRNAAENRALKDGLVEWNNVDLNYFNVPLIVPSLVFSFISVASFVAAVVVALRTDLIPSDEQMRLGVLMPYGSIRLPCNSTIPFPEDGLPSILNLFERNAIGNVLFRLSVCIPVVLRIFQSLCFRNMVRAQQRAGLIFEVTSDLLPAFTAMETFALALFSIITVHSDFPSANRFAKLTFAMTSTLNMISTTIILFNFKSATGKKLDSLSLGVKMVSSFAYCYLAPQYFQKHHAFTTLPMCHTYIPRIYALIEYVLIACYGAFHLTWLIDIRNVYFLTYPRDCSGECEPLDPANFLPGGKYEHCRAFEYRQRQIAQGSMQIQAITKAI